MIESWQEFRWLMLYAVTVEAINCCLYRYGEWILQALTLEYDIFDIPVNAQMYAVVLL
ncbi:putative cell wall hydrolase/LysM protein [Salmonella phage 19]|nr:putative cell wall hydrolase/LysM protein [Salmonella phage 19]